MGSWPPLLLQKEKLMSAGGWVLAACLIFDVFALVFALVHGEKTPWDY
jgi:hypothetical protein